MDKLEQAKELLKENNQFKVLNILGNLDEEKKGKLAKELLKVDFEQVHRLYENTDGSTYF